MSDSQYRYQDYIGRSRTHSETLTAFPARAMAALLDLSQAPDNAGDALPPLWHWLYFLEAVRQTQLTDDGHPRRGDFLPPVPLPRRMWAGSRLRLHRPLHIGQTVTRHSTIESVDCKQGRSGELAFVGIAHTYQTESAACIEEEQTLVFRQGDNDRSSAPEPIPAPAKRDFEQLVAPSPSLLFRYSALTFNAHRIHYDRHYATATEHYPGLVVHGPLLATLLLQLLARERPDLPVRDFSFRALAPVCDPAPFRIAGRQCGDDEFELWVEDDRKNLCMQASAGVAVSQTTTGDSSAGDTERV